MFAKVLIANRGEIACRILRTLKRLEIGSVAVFSDADRHAPHVLEADEAIFLGAGSAAETYLRQDKILAAAQRTHAAAVHPGYGFLSENADFAQRCAEAGIVFVGPSPQHLRDFGLKHLARELALKNAVPLLPGSGLLSSAEHARVEAARIGYPVMLKSTAGGGGIGMQLVRHEGELEPALLSVERLATKSFSRGGAYLEKYIERARHIEVQIFGDGRGRVVALGDRDCSTQRRNQKIIEETPASDLDEGLRGRLHAAAIRLGEAVNYRSAGTVEFVYDTSTADFYFLEVNTRLQVEHGITEEVTGVDLVEWMLRQAAQDDFSMQFRAPRGAAIEVRIYAEDPAKEFRPVTGLLTRADFAAQARVDTWVAAGTEVTPLYDPLLAKLITVGESRAAALENMRAALAATVLAGIETNLDYLRQLLADPLFIAGGMTTRALDAFSYAPRTVDVVAPGTQTTIQDFPGRVGYWNIGVPPSGPMDDFSFRLANRALGNAVDAAALEITVSGPTLRFNVDQTICLTGADLAATIDGEPIEQWTSVSVRKGQTLHCGRVAVAGSRAYLSIRGGFDVPLYLGSRATFTLGKFGGHGGRPLQAGDVLHVNTAEGCAPCRIPPAIRPAIANDWELGVLYGPHAAPEFFTDADMQVFFSSTWEVHYNSNRTGVRLLGPKPGWARSDGGEAGLHPSNIHDTAYAIGAVDFTGDMPVILGPDGPSLGGFVCPVSLAASELWKLGQLRPHDRVRFRRLTPDEALASQFEQDEMLRTLQPRPSAASFMRQSTDHTAGRNGADAAIVGTLPARGDHPEVVYRRAGDKYLLVEYGPLVLDLELRFRVHALMGWLETAAVTGVIESTPGIRSLQVHYESRILPLATLLNLLIAAEADLPPIDSMEVPTRIVRMPLAWDDDATQLAIAKYMQSVRADAPWCPSNIEFIRRINGLDSVDEVKRIVFDASYLVLGLGDVYLGAPVCTPIDPRHRLVTTKYNPARTWTPENAVGIGGAYLCIYGMEGPGGYQFIGRTCQVWNSYRTTVEFQPDAPWLLRIFDQIQFYPVSSQELTKIRDDFLHGRFSLQIREQVLRLQDYRRFMQSHSADINAFKLRQQAAFDAERSRWEATGQIGYAAPMPDLQDQDVTEQLPEDVVPVASPVSGSVWKLAVRAGQRVTAGEVLVWIESMKMELPVVAPLDGIVVQMRCVEGRAVLVAQTLLVLRPDSN